MSLIHWWPLNGNLNDYGTEGATPGSGGVVDNNGKIGKCYKCLSSNRMTLPYTVDSPTSVFTIAMWIKIPSSMKSNTGWQTVWTYSCLNNGSATSKPASWAGYQNLKIYSSSDHQYWWLAPGTNFNYDQWFHVTLVHTADNTQTTTCYVNGTSIGKQTSTVSLQLASGNFVFGHDVPEIYFNDIRIYDHALSKKEVKEISKGLVLHYNFEDAYVEGTTNLLNSSYPSSTPSAYNSSFQTLTETYHGNPVIHCTGTSSTNSGFRYGVSVNLASGESVTFSLYLRYNGSKTNFSSYHAGSADGSYRDPLVSRGLSTGGTGQSTWVKETITIYDENRQKVLNWDNVVVGKWYFIETNLTNVFSSQITISNYYFLGGSNAGTWDITCPQLEKKDHATPYVNGTRSAGKVYDNSGYGYNSTTTSNITITEDSKSGLRCANFNGSSSYVMGPKLEFMDKAITVNVWAKASSWTTTSAKKIISCTESGGWQITLTSDSKLKFYPYINGYKTVDVAESTLTDTWHMITGVYDGSNVKLYVDGVQVSTTAVTGSITYGNAPVTVGAEPSTSTTSVSGDYFNGKIGDVKIFSTALSANDILAEYQTKASIDKNGNIFASEFVEEYDNINITKTSIVKTSHFEEGTDLVKFNEKYTELEYLVFSGAQQVDTGTKFDMQNGSCEITFQSSTTSQNGMLIASTSSNYFWLYYYNNANKINLYVYASGQKVVQGDTLDLNKHTIAYRNKHMYIDGVDKGSFSVTLSETTGNVYIGSYGGNYFFQGKVFSCRLYDGDNNLIRNFIPAKRKSDNVLGLYDLVNRVFYTNSGSGSFTAGPEVGTLSIVYANQIIEE